MWSGKLNLQIRSEKKSHDTYRCIDLRGLSWNSIREDNFFQKTLEITKNPWKITKNPRGKSLKNHKNQDFENRVEQKAETSNQKFLCWVPGERFLGHENDFTSKFPCLDLSNYISKNRLKMLKNPIIFRYMCKMLPKFVKNVVWSEIIFKT